MRYNNFEFGGIIMKILFIDTHSEILKVIIKNGEDTVEIDKSGVRSHSEIAIPSIIELLNRAGCKIEELNSIVVVNGPGSFTGVRIGVTIAKTLAYSLAIPIKTITSLEAYGVSSNSEFDIIAIPDSKGYYSAKKIDNTFLDFAYRKKSDFEKYIEDNNFSVSYSDKIDFDEILKYIKDKEPTNHHNVNPIYIKEIAALK